MRAIRGDTRSLDNGSYRVRVLGLSVSKNLGHIVWPSDTDLSIEIYIRATDVRKLRLKMRIEWVRCLVEGSGLRAKGLGFRRGLNVEVCLGHQT